MHSGPKPHALNQSLSLSVSPLGPPLSICKIIIIILQYWQQCQPTLTQGGRWRISKHLVNCHLTTSRPSTTPSSSERLPQCLSAWNRFFQFWYKNASHASKSNQKLLPVWNCHWSFGPKLKWLQSPCSCCVYTFVLNAFLLAVFCYLCPWLSFQLDYNLVQHMNHILIVSVYPSPRRIPIHGS